MTLTQAAAARAGIEYRTQLRLFRAGAEDRTRPDMIRVLIAEAIRYRKIPRRDVS